MKKILIAGAMLAAMGLAQAQVTVYGKMRVYEESVTVGSASALVSQTNDSSRLGFKGTEALGSGLNANFTIETGIGADAPGATTLGDRTMTVGLSNSFGSIAGGRDKHTIARTLDNYDAMGNAYGSSASTIHASQGSRVQNAVFLTATPVTGLSVSYINSNSEVAGVTSAQAASVEYTRGPFSATVARYDSGTTSASNIYGARFAVAQTKTTLFGMYSDDTVAGVASTGKSIGVNQPLTASLTALASYGEKEGTKAYDVGATYSLSKRTMIHARYVKEDASVTTTKYALGVEHNF